MLHEPVIFSEEREGKSRVMDALCLDDRTHKPLECGGTDSTCWTANNTDNPMRSAYCATTKVPPIHFCVSQKYVRQGRREGIASSPITVGTCRHYE